MIIFSDFHFFRYFNFRKDFIKILENNFEKNIRIFENDFFFKIFKKLKFFLIFTNFEKHKKFGNNFFFQN